MGLNYKNLNPYGLYFAFLFELETEKKFNPSLGLKSKSKRETKQNCPSQKFCKGFSVLSREIA